MRRGFFVLIILVFSFLPYINSLQNQFVYDDRHLIVNNKLIHEGRLKELLTTPYWGERKYGLWRPLTTLTFRLNYLLTDLRPFSFHLFNTLLHAGVSLTLFFFFLQLGFQENVSFWASLIFAVHPVHVESVTWIVGRAEILSVFFLLLSLYFLTKSHILSFLLSPLFFFLSLLSKETGVVTPLLYIAYYFSRKEREKREKFLINLLLLLVTFTIYLFLRIKVLKGVIGPVGTAEYFYGYPPTTPLFTFPRIFAEYLRLAFFPFYLSVDYTFPPIQHPSPLFLSLLLLLIAYLSFLILFYCRRHPLSFPLLFFLISLFPYSHFIPIGWLLGERFLYLGSVASSLILAYGFTRLKKRIYIPLLSILILSFSIRTWWRNQDWRDEKTLWITTARQNPYSIRAWYNLGTFAQEEGKFLSALNFYRRAISLIGEVKKSSFGDIFNNTGLALVNLGRIKEAEEMFTRALSYNPYMASAYTNLGNIYLNRGDLEKALKFYRKALILNPAEPRVYKNISWAYLRMNDLEKAKIYARKFLEKFPRASPSSRAEVYNYLAVIAEKRGNRNQAFLYLQQALKEDRNFPLTHLNLGNIYLVEKKWNRAEKEYEEALSKGAPAGVVYRNLGRLFMEKGDLEKAKTFLKKSLRVEPGSSLTRFYLAKIEKLLQGQEKPEE